MQIFFAPMEGLTDAVFRRVHHACFGGVDAYYMPFISPTQGLTLNAREKRDLQPENNAGVTCVPQILTKDPEHFLWAAGIMAGLGYTEVDLNAGCPSGTVTAKGKGAGILRQPMALDDLLEAVCARSPMPVSVKTRIAYSDPEEWAKILDVYARYPIRRLIVHPRTCRDRYAPGTVHMECWQAACERFPGELVYNGDLFGPDDVTRLLESCPREVGLMLGRGLVAVPSLARTLRGGAPLQKEELARFHDSLLRELSAVYQPDIVFMKLRVVMKHLECCFADTGRLAVEIRHARRLDELLTVDRRLFDTRPLKAEPRFVPDELRSF